ncbi:MAG: four helix bundle protein [Clostridia bacterium]|nr:four helix bundle protein [Clostridia bacterium]
MQLVKEVYSVLDFLPNQEKFALSDQIRRAVVSIPSNIAEGYSRNSDREFLQFLYIARGSKSELETQLEIAEMLGYLKENQLQEINVLLEEIGKMLNKLISTIKKS